MFHEIGGLDLGQSFVALRAYFQSMVNTSKVMKMLFEKVRIGLPQTSNWFPLPSHNDTILTLIQGLVFLFNPPKKVEKTNEAFRIKKDR